MFGLERMAPYSIFFIDVNDINLFPYTLNSQNTDDPIKTKNIFFDWLSQSGDATVIEHLSTCH